MTTDLETYKLLYSLITAGMTARGYTVTVTRSEADRLTPAPDGPAVIFSSLDFLPYGYPAKTETWDSDTSTMTHTEVQKWIQKYQVTAFSPYAYSDDTAPAAADLCRAAHSVMQADSTISTLLASGVELFRITAVRQTTVKNDRDVFEKIPSFDVSLSFDTSYSEDIDSTSEIAGSLNGV